MIVLEHNCGFGKANNLVLKEATTKYAFILNPDTIITAEAIDNLIKIADKDLKIALANPKDLSKEEYYNQDNKINKIDEIIESDFVCGGYLLMKMSIFKKIGFFDKNLFLYGDDDDLSLRSKEYGYKNIIAKNIYVFHNQHSSTKTQGMCSWLKLYFKRYWYLGWSKTYLKLKRNKMSKSKILFKTIMQFFSILYFCLILDYKRIVERLGRSCGSFANIINIDCFNKKNKIAKIKKNSYLNVIISYDKNFCLYNN